MYPAELARTMARGAEHAEHFAIQRQLIDSSRVAIRRIEHLARARRNADCPRRAVLHGLVQRHRRLGAGRNLRRQVSHPRVDAVIVGHVDVNLPQELAFSVKHLNSPVAAIGYIHVARVVGGNTVWGTELPRATPRLTPRLDPISISVDLGNP